MKLNLFVSPDKRISRARRSPPKLNLEKVEKTILEAPSSEANQRELLKNYSVPDLTEMETCEPIGALPSLEGAQNVLTSPATGDYGSLVPLKILGTSYLINPQRARLSNKICKLSFFKLKRVVYMPKEEREKFLSLWLKKHEFSDFALNLVHTLLASENSTQRAYFRKLIQMEEFFASRFPEKVHGLDFAAILKLPQLPRMLIVFLHYRSQDNVALATLQGYPTAIGFARKLLCLPPLPDLPRIKVAIRALCRTTCRKPQGTRAIPTKYLKRFFQFLKRFGVRTYVFFSFAFWAGSRASEAVKIKVSSFYFFRTTEGRPAVRLKFIRPKTKKKYMDDHHTVIFSESPKSFLFCPYRMAVWFCQTYSDDSYLIPIKAKSDSARQARMYSWFNSLKSKFEIYHHEQFGSDVNTRFWKFHSFRTTLIGVLKNAGLDWAQIQLRVGHKLDSPVTRETYYMNSILTTGFDQTFDKILAENENVSDLMNQVGDLTLEPQKSSQISPPAVVRQPNRKKKSDRRGLNFRRGKKKLKLQKFSNNYNKVDVPCAVKSYRRLKKFYY